MHNLITVKICDNSVNAIVTDFIFIALIFIIRGDLNGKIFDTTRIDYFLDKAEG